MTTTDDGTLMRTRLLEVDAPETLCQPLADAITHLALAIAADTGALADQSAQIIARKRDWNAKSNGTEEHRRVILPGESASLWAAEAGETSGYWAARDFRAIARSAKESVIVPIGTIVVEFERKFRGGQPTGRAEVAAGMVVRPGTTGQRIEWDLRWRRKGESVEVWTPARDEWMTV